jgi:putative oxidoreductase
MNRAVGWGFSTRGWTDGALLVLRASLGSSLFLRHGLEKLTGYAQMAAHFPDPLHIGARASLAFALLSDAICSVLVVLGLATRFAALIICINLGVAFGLVHHFSLHAPNSGELAYVYLAGFLAILVAGGGRYSLDSRLH